MCLVGRVLIWEMLGNVDIQRKLDLGVKKCHKSQFVYILINYFSWK